jgi:hypothetical protein
LVLIEPPYVNGETFVHTKPALSAFVFGIFGGFVGCFLFFTAAAYAQSALNTSFLTVVGADGQQRIQAAVYNAPNEAGQPLLGLFDNSHDLRLLFRLAGGNSSPVIVIKDRNHKDRLVLGLALNDPAQEPFMATFDKNGNKRMVFGNY